MKFRVSFKTPDALDCIKDELGSEFCELHDPDHGNVDEDPDYCSDCHDRRDKRRHMQVKMEDLAQKFIKYGEYVVIEFDTETGTATVVPVKR